MTGTSHAAEDLLALRQVIARLAARDRLDLADRQAVRRFLDGDFSTSPEAARDPQSSHELRAMMILLFRLEASSSEDLGIDGLRRLWHQHGEILARFRAHEPLPAGCAE